MLKRDRTYEERRFDAMLKTGLRCLGESPSGVTRSEVAESLGPSNNTYSQVLYWDRMGRKGQKCRIVNPDKNSGRNVQVQFEDGFIAVINRRAIRRGGS